jgi:signal transduction histidine kinase
MTRTVDPAPIPLEQAEKIRTYSHDLSNALEIIIQTSYLLGMANLDENGRQWCQMLDQGVQQAAKVNRELRDYIHKNS